MLSYCYYKTMCYASVEICTGMRSFIPYYNRSTTVVRSYYICTTITERKLFFENYRKRIICRNMKIIKGKRSEKLQKVHWVIFEHNNLDLVLVLGDMTI